MDRAPETASHRLARFTFEGVRRVDAAGVPRVHPEFVAEQGQLVRILDVREPEELLGLLGHIPAVTSVPMTCLHTVPVVLGKGTIVILVSSTGQRAGIAARYLSSLGMPQVAAMEGGMVAWKKLGFATPRDERSIRRELRALPPGVGRDGRALHPPHEGHTLTAEEIVEHVGDPGSVRWVKLAAFLMHGKRSCVDGRDDHGVIGTPGGDMGEIVLALSAAENVRDRPLGDAEVEQVLVDHVDTFGRFYMHTDTTAMNRMIVEGYRKDPRIAPHLDGVFDATTWRAWHLRTPHAVREAVLEHLVKPENLGCGHLRLAMTRPEYRVRPELMVALLRAFHRLRWDGAPELEWVVLGGEHFEGAVLEVVLERELHTYTRVPLVSPQVDGVQAFVSHPQITSYLRHETAAFLVESGVVAEEHREHLEREIDERGRQQLAATLASLAAGLPVHRVRFANGTATVETVGVVGGPGSG